MFVLVLVCVQATGVSSQYVKAIPLGRLGTKFAIAMSAVFLCSEASSYMTGQNVVIDGGRTVL